MDIDLKSLQANRVPLRLSSAILAIFVPLNFWSYVFFSPVLIGASLLLATIGIGLENRLLFAPKSKTEQFIILLIPIAILFALIGTAFKPGNEALTNLAWLIGSAVWLLYAFIVSREPDRIKKIIFFTLWTYQAFILAFLLKNYDISFPLEYFIPGFSSNGVTSFLIVLQVVYSTLVFRINGKITILTPAITFYICLLGYGRGSIIAASIFILVCLFLYFFKKNNKSYAQFGGLILGILFISLAIKFGPIVLDYVIQNTKLASGLYDQHRYRIFLDYLQNIDEWNLFFGAPFEGTVIAESYRGNSHSSFIRMHNIGGLLYFLTIVSVFVFLPFSLKGFRSSIFAFSGSLVLMFRSVSEPIFFITPLDFYFFVFAFVLLGAGKVLPSALGKSNEEQATYAQK